MNPTAHGAGGNTTYPDLSEREVYKQHDKDPQ